MNWTEAHLLGDLEAMTEANKHTRGPWVIGRLESYEFVSGIAFRRVYFPTVNEEIQEAHVRGDNCDANAHLIAAAPDLLDALERLAHLQSGGLCTGALARQWLDEARAAIAKAKGETK